MSSKLWQSPSYKNDKTQEKNFWRGANNLSDVIGKGKAAAIMELANISESITESRAINYQVVDGSAKIYQIFFSSVHNIGSDEKQGKWGGVVRANIEH